MALFNFLPNGIYDFLNIDWNKIDVSNTTFNAIPADNEYDWGWGDYPVNGETPEVYKAKVQVESQKGNQIGAKIFGAVLVYGPTVLQLLRGLNVIKSNGTVDNEKALETLSQTDGKLDPNTLSGIKLNGFSNGSQNTILGVPVSYVALGIGGLVLYKLFKDDKKKRK